MSTMAEILGGGLGPHEVSATRITTVTCDHKITTDNKIVQMAVRGFWSIL